MNREKNNEATNLQHSADVLITCRPAKTPSVPKDDQWNLMYQLRESQLELKLQNHKLNLALSKIADAVRLFDTAPAGIFTLSREGEIINLNICGSKMLNKKRENLIKSRFGFFVSDDSKRTFNKFIEKILTNKTSETCQLTLSPDNNIFMYVQLIGVASENAEQCLVTMADITGLNQAKLKLALQIEEKEKLAAMLADANKEKTKQLEALFIANKEKEMRVAKLAKANKEKSKRIADLVIANKEKARLAGELIIANKEKAKQIAELAKANNEKESLAQELLNTNKEKVKRAAEFIIANEEKAERAARLFIATCLCESHC